MASVYSNGSFDEEEQQDDSQSVNGVEKFEDKLLQAIENATEKSAQTRTQAIQTICDILQHRHIPDFVDDRKITIMDIAEKSLRRGKGSEQEWAARLAPLLIIQLGGEDEVSTTLSAVLHTIVQNKSNSYSVRAWSSTSLALLNFLGCDDIGHTIEAMRLFEQLFAGSYLKGDKTTPTVSEDAAQLHVAALGAWGLLATLIPSGDFCTSMNNGSLGPTMSNLIGMLKSSHVEVRMACGELIAIILECGRAHDEDFMEDHIPDLIDVTAELAKDAQKFRAKKERKAQRASFRDVLRYLEVGSYFLDSFCSHFPIITHFNCPFTGGYHTKYSNSFRQRNSGAGHVVDWNSISKIVRNHRSRSNNTSC